ncbi:MAG TPA: phage major capsid protein [Gemmataceae bacterium]|jgi:HK97 family phage major capsid protein|nr:phage major capsid protein [Gemmataceae bacterium]
MAVIAVVLDKPLGELEEGSVLHVEDEAGQALISAGLAHEASEDEVNGGEGDEPEADEAGDEGDESPSADEVLNLGKRAEAAVEKATTSAVEKIVKANKSYSLPSVKVNKSAWTVEQNERKGGFPTFKSFLDCAIAAKFNDLSASKKMDDYMRLRTKGAMNVGTSTAGGSLIPQQWADEIYALSFSGGPAFLEMMSKYEMQNQVINVPEFNITAGNTGITASVTNENTAITDTTALTNTVQLSLVKLGVLVNITDEMLRFQHYNLEAYIRQHVPAKLRFKINDSILNGTSSGVNLIGNAAKVTITRGTSGHITFPDIVAMWTSLYTDFQSESCWIINPTAYGDLMKLAFPNGSGTYPIFLPTPPNYSGGTGNASYAPAGTLFGRPVHVCEQAAALGSVGDIILVHFPSIACGYLPLDSAQTNALYFDKAVDSLRFLQYIATKNLVLSPYTRADSTTCSNIVVVAA